MRRRFLLLFLLLVCSTCYLKAQTVGDLFRISQNQYINSARAAGVGGAFGSLGADISTANINPAGIAEFRKSEIVIGGNFVANRYEADLNGTTSTSDGSRQKFQLGTIAGVFTSNPVKFDIKTMNIAVGINQLSSFQDFFSYEGTSPGTYVERFRELAQGLRVDELDPFEAGPAFDAEAILEGDTPGDYTSDFETFDEVVRRAESVNRTGSLNELFITMASNIKNKFSWGVTLGVPIINYNETKNYTETDDADNVAFFNVLDYNQNLELSGAGINLKAGLIYKLTPKIRAGLALHSPTVYAITDNFSTDINYNFSFDGQDITRSGSSGLAPFEYQTTTPWRALAGISMLYRAGDLKGFVSGDVEYLNYGSASYSLNIDGNPADEAFLQAVSDEASELGASAVNLRVGTELAYKSWRLRAGGSMQSSPYKDTASLDPDIGYHGGVGFRMNKIYLDAAYSHRRFNRDYTPYRLANPQFEQRINNRSSFGTISLTLGFKI